jgi:hypothetical protein
MKFFSESGVHLLANPVKHAQYIVMKSINATPATIGDYCLNIYNSEG